MDLNFSVCDIEGENFLFVFLKYLFSVDQGDVIICLVFIRNLRRCWHPSLLPLVGVHGLDRWEIMLEHLMLVDSHSSLTSTGCCWSCSFGCSFLSWGSALWWSAATSLGSVLLLLSNWRCHWWSNSFFLSLLSWLGWGLGGWLCWSSCGGLVDGSTKVLRN